MYIAGLSGWKLKLASWMFGSEDGTSQQEATGKQCLSQNTNNAREARLWRHNHQNWLGWKLTKSEIQAEMLHSFSNAELIQFCISSIHIPSSMRKGIKLWQEGGPNMHTTPQVPQFFFQNEPPPFPAYLLFFRAMGLAWGHTRSVAMQLPGNNNQSSYIGRCRVTSALVLLIHLLFYFFLFFFTVFLSFCVGKIPILEHYSYLIVYMTIHGCILKSPQIISHHVRYFITTSCQRKNWQAGLT